MQGVESATIKSKLVFVPSGNINQAVKYTVSNDAALLVRPVTSNLLFVVSTSILKTVASYTDFGSTQTVQGLTSEQPAGFVMVGGLKGRSST